MTKYFEIIDKNGSARLGNLKLKQNIRTPALIDTPGIKDFESLFIDLGSMWNSSNDELIKIIKHIQEKGSCENLVIVPHQIFTPTVGNIKSSFLDDISNSIPIGLVYDGYKKDNVDMYIISGSGIYSKNARRFFEQILEIKSNVPFDTAIYAPAVALPQNIATLTYLGVDLFDSTAVLIASSQDMYLTTYGFYDINQLSELPCMCQDCSSLSHQNVMSMTRKERFSFLKKHNINVIKAELANVRQKIKDGCLREYVESQSSSSPLLTSLLRHSDNNPTYMEKITEIVRSRTLIANTSDSLHRIEFSRFSQRTLDRYSPPDNSVCLILPCSARKPYSFSQSHQKYIKALGKYRKYIHEIILSSPLGVIPRELELTYPAAHYDIAVTGHWSEDEKKIVADRLSSYLKYKSGSKKIVAHVEGAYREICERVSLELNIDIIYTATGKTTSKDSLSNLRKTVSLLLDESSNFRNLEPRKMLKSIADYQFGSKIGEILVPNNSIIKGPYPKYQVYIDQDQIATLIPQYGILALTIEGAKLIADENKYTVYIDDFIPKGSILVPGIINVDPDIRPKDEVIVKGPRVICVGRAVMSAYEMMNSSYGIAVDIRHVQKLDNS